MKLLASARFTVVSVALLGSIACGAQDAHAADAARAGLRVEDLDLYGNVKTGGTVSFPFTVVNPGRIRSRSPNWPPSARLPMGIAMGFWDAATSTCAEQLRTTAATINVAFAATPSSPGEYCVGIFDTGNVQVSTDFTLSSHALLSRRDYCFTNF